MAVVGGADGPSVLKRHWSVVAASPCRGSNPPLDTRGNVDAYSGLLVVMTNAGTMPDVLWRLGVCGAREAAQGCRGDGLAVFSDAADRTVQEDDSKVVASMILNDSNWKRGRGPQPIYVSNSV